MKIGRIFKGFHKGQKGFTLVELLIVVAILGILAAVAVPNLVSFIGTGETEARATELDVAQTAVIAAMADASVATVDTPGALNSTADVDVDGDATGDVGDFLVGGVASLAYSYTVAADGTVTQLP